jgi:hypothetical protein
LSRENRAGSVMIARSWVQMTASGEAAFLSGG